MSEYNKPENKEGRKPYERRQGMKVIAWLAMLILGFVAFLVLISVEADSLMTFVYIKGVAVATLLLCMAGIRILDKN